MPKSGEVQTLPPHLALLISHRLWNKATTRLPESPAVQTCRSVWQHKECWQQPLEHVAAPCPPQGRLVFISLMRWPQQRGDTPCCSHFGTARLSKTLLFTHQASLENFKSAPQGFSKQLTILSWFPSKFSMPESPIHMQCSVISCPPPFLLLLVITALAEN